MKQSISTTPTSNNSTPCFSQHSAYTYMGAHPVEQEGVSGWQFRVWAPNALMVSVVGAFNYWDASKHPMEKEKDGIWSLFIPGLQQYDLYQFAIKTRQGNLIFKADPYAFHADTRPNTASKLYDLGEYQWGDGHWMHHRKDYDARPLNIYEVHLSSWRRTGEGDMLNYRDIATYLVPYVKELGYTHVAMMPVMEHPRDASFGYLATGYFAVTSRHGTPTDFMYLVDQLHQAGVGVILDWNPGSTASDDFGLCNFDGTHCYERPESGGSYGGYEFDFSKPQVCEFLASSQFFWIEQFHADGMRITTVPEGSPPFLIKLGKALRTLHPDIFTIRPNVPGTNDDYVYDTDWTGGMLECLGQEARERYGPIIEDSSIQPRHVDSFSHELLTPPYSSVASRMSGADDNVRFATVRAFYTVFLCRSGRKLTMMGTEFGQWSAWQYQQSLDWHLLQYNFYQKQQLFFKTANALYLSSPALWGDRPPNCQFDSDTQCLTVFSRSAPDEDTIYAAANFTDQTVEHFAVKVPETGEYEVILNTDDPAFGGQGGSSSGVLTAREGIAGPTVFLTLLPNTAVVLKKHPIQ